MQRASNFFADGKFHSEQGQVINKTKWTRSTVLCVNGFGFFVLRYTKCASPGEFTMHVIRSVLFLHLVITRTPNNLKCFWISLEGLSYQESTVHTSFLV